MNTQRYNAQDVHNAIRRLNEDAGRPVELLNKPTGAGFNVGHFDCDKGGGVYYKLYEISNTHGGERTIAYAQTAQLACSLIDVFRQGFVAGSRAAIKAVNGLKRPLAEYGPEVV